MALATNQAPVSDTKELAQGFAQRSYKEIEVAYRRILDAVTANTPLAEADPAPKELCYELLERLHSGHFTTWKRRPAEARQALLLWEQSDNRWQTRCDLPPNLQPLLRELFRPCERLRTALKALTNT